MQNAESNQQQAGIKCHGTRSDDDERVINAK